MKTIDISTKKYPNTFVKVDDADYERISAIGKWYPQKVRVLLYASRKPGKHKIQMHREILGTPPGVSVDHIDGDPLNNQRSNLRECTVSENNQNRGKFKSTTLSKYKGVTMDRGRYRAVIRHNKKTNYLGYFDVEADAALAYNAAAIDLHGSFAHLNIIE